MPLTFPTKTFNVNLFSVWHYKSYYFTGGVPEVLIIKIEIIWSRYKVSINFYYIFYENTGHEDSEEIRSTE